MAKVSDSDIDRLRSVVGLGSEKTAQPATRREVEIAPMMQKTPYATDDSKDNQLFVKIEEHDGILSSLDEAKRDIKSIADTIELLARAEKLKADAIERMEHHIGDFEGLLESIEARIVPPEDVLRQNVAAVDKQQTTKLSSDLKSLKATLEQLK